MSFQNKLRNNEVLNYYRFLSVTFPPWQVSFWRHCIGQHVCFPRFELKLSTDFWRTCSLKFSFPLLCWIVYIHPLLPNSWFLSQRAYSLRIRSVCAVLAQCSSSLWSGLIVTIKIQVRRKLSYVVFGELIKSGLKKNLQAQKSLVKLKNRFLESIA